MAGNTPNHVPPERARSVAIFHKAHAFSPTGIHSGAEMATIHLARALARSGVHVTVLGHITTGDTEHDGVSYLDVGPTYDIDRGLERVNGTAGLNRKTHALIAVTRADVLARSLAYRNIERRFLWLQDSDVGELCLDIARVDDVVDGIIYVSEALREFLERQELPKSKGHVIPNGFDASVFHPLDDSFDRHRITYAGALLPEKGVDLLSEAFHLASERLPDAKLWIYGSSALWGRAEHYNPERIRALNERIHFAGNVTQSELACAFRRSAVVVIPSRRSLRFEPFPLTSIEAQACGSPVIVARNGGLPEGIRAGETGWVLENEDGAALAELMVNALSDGERLRSMRRRAVEHATENYDWEHIAASYLDLVKQTPAKPFVATRRAPTHSPPRTHQIAVFYVRLPQPDRYGGDFRAYRLIRSMARAGHRVVLVARDALMDPAENARYRVMYERLGVEVHVLNRVTRRGGGWHPIAIRTLEDVVGGRHFDAAWVLWWNLVLEFIPQLRRLLPGARLVADSVDVAYLRLFRQASLNEVRDDWRLAAYTRRQEHLAYRMADRVITVTEDDASVLRSDSPGIDVRVIPNVHALAASPVGFDARRDLMFVGFYEHLPNADAALYFTNEIFPKIKNHLPDVKLYLVGNAPPSSVRALARADVIVTGYVPDLSEYWQMARVSLAPLRYGAGMKGKIGQSMAEGLPVVTSSIGAEGMDLVDGEHALIADEPAAFAQAVVSAYSDRDLWTKLSQKGRELVDERWSDEVVRDRLLASLVGEEDPVPSKSNTQAVEAANRLWSVARGYEWMDLGCPQAARLSFEAAIDRDASSGYVGLAELLEHEGQLDEALQALQRALDVAATSTAVRAKLGALLRRCGYLREAQFHLEQTLIQDPTQPVAVREIARLAELAGADLDAAKLYRSLLEKNPADPEALARSAAVLANGNDLSSAHRLLLEALSVVPRVGEAASKEMKRALEDLENRLNDVERHFKRPDGGWVGALPPNPARIIRTNSQ